MICFEDDPEISCASCDVPAKTKCSCGEDYCEECYKRHLLRRPAHFKLDKRLQSVWKWVSGKCEILMDDVSQHTQFERDEGAKWFGLHIEKRDTNRIARIVETARFTSLAEDSIYKAHASPSRQFPRLVSFVGETGAGKSTLIRSLIWDSAKCIDGALDKYDAPVPGSSNGAGAFSSTTGEVSLYPDPITFGTSSPCFYVDCEGTSGAEPVSSRHQSRWYGKGREYLLQTEDGTPLDRSTAVKTIYPKFLYLFSEVICMVTKNPRTCAETVIKLLKWGEAGANNAVNLHALPAVIIILNQPQVEDVRWLSSDMDVVKKDFFDSIDRELEENNELRAMAQKEDDQTLEDLLLRKFSSIHVFYVPSIGHSQFGTPETVLKQTGLLFQCIREESYRVHNVKAKTWKQFDSNQLSILFDYAFKHFAKRSNEPFDFSRCRSQIGLPETAESHITQFLQCSLRDRVDKNFLYAADAVGSSLVRNALKGKDAGKCIWRVCTM
ncbi:hypothetical protein AOQ84DRAFT_402023 [Glonium stellatum]|uniref:Uncharacterized protein n=1 Tax=Glonium stellatum TaxID=574774 RepID=A0A8E2F4T2_9PEZI|nr:hypothetical protein AOQ84DRAFT_402023 [Glonium stellatum]